MLISIIVVHLHVARLRVADQRILDVCTSLLASQFSYKYLYSLNDYRIQLRGCTCSRRARDKTRVIVTFICRCSFYMACTFLYTFTRATLYCIYALDISNLVRLYRHYFTIFPLHRCYAAATHTYARTLYIYIYFYLYSLERCR